MHLLHESLVGQCEYIVQPKDCFWCHAIYMKGAVILLIFTNEFVFMVLYFTVSFRYLVQLMMSQSLKNEATWG